MAEFTWFVPSTGDGEYLGNSKLWSDSSVKYCAEVGKIAEEGGLDALLFPAGSNNLDPWIAATHTASVTNRIKLIIAVRASSQQPLVTAQMTRSLEQLAGNRVGLNIVTAGMPVEYKRYGDSLDDKNARYCRTEEFSEVLNRLWNGDMVKYDGTYFNLDFAKLLPQRKDNHKPYLFITGNTEKAMEIASKYHDYYLYSATSMDEIISLSHKLKAVSEERKSSVKPAVTFDFVARKTEAEAWEAAERIVSRVSRERQIKLALYYEGLREKGMTIYDRIRENNYIIDDYFWAGLMKVRFGAGPCLVGSYEKVASAFNRLIENGIESFFIRSYPYKDEIVRFSSEIMPKIHREKEWCHGSVSNR